MEYSESLIFVVRDTTSTILTYNKYEVFGLNIIIQWVIVWQLCFMTNGNTLSQTVLHHYILQHMKQKGKTVGSEDSS